MKTKTKKRTWRWVTRDGQADYVLVWTNPDEPIWYSSFNSFMDANSEVVAICFKEFKKLFGFIPAKGKCLKVEFKARKIK